MLARHVNDRIEDGFEITKHITDGDDPAALTLARALNVRGVPAVYAYDSTGPSQYFIFIQDYRFMMTKAGVENVIESVKNQLTDALPKSPDPSTADDSGGESSGPSV